MPCDGSACGNGGASGTVGEWLVSAFWIGCPWDFAWCCYCYVSFLSYAVYAAVTLFVCYVALLMCNMAGRNCAACLCDMLCCCGKCCRKGGYVRVGDKH